MKPITEEQRQSLITACKEEISRLKELAEQHEFLGNDYLLEQTNNALLRQEIALASLTDEPVGVVNRGEVSDNNEYPEVKVDCAHPHAGWENFQDGFKLYTAPPVPVIKMPDEHSFDAWFKAIEAGDDQDWSEPEYLSKEWHGYIGRRQLALGTYRFAINETKHLNGPGE